MCKGNKNPKEISNDIINSEELAEEDLLDGEAEALLRQIRQMEEDEKNGLERVQQLNANLREQQGLLPRDDEQTHHLQQQPEDEPIREQLMGPREHEMDATIRNALEQLEKRVDQQEESIQQMKLRISELEQQNITLRQKLDELRELQDHLQNQQSQAGGQYNP